MRYGFGGLWHGSSLLSLVGPIAMGLFWILFVTAIVMLIVYLARQSRVSHSGTALAILKERYARGEIAREEYDQKRKDLLT